MDFAGTVQESFCTWLDLASGRAEEAPVDGSIPFRQAIDVLPQCIFWKDKAGRFLTCNRAGAKALGLAHPDEIDGKTDADFHRDPEVANYLRIEDERVMQDGLPIYRHLSQGQGPADSAPWFETSKIPLRNAHGEIVGLLICYDDVTERMRMEELLRRANEQLELRIGEATAEAAARERLLLQQSRYAGLGEMIGCIAHQWRQPLTTLGLLLQNLKYDARDGMLDARLLDEKIGHALDVVERMSATIEYFRNFFRPPAKATVFAAGDCVDDVLKLMAPSLDAANIRVDVDVASPCMAAGRQNDLSQVMLNLLGNARDALVVSDAAERTVWIDIARCGGDVCIVERNNGGAIAEADLGRIFDPYYTTKAEGTGLGLHMSKLILERHFGGTISCRNTADGVEFEIRLPAAEKSVEMPRRCPARRAAEAE